MNHDDERLPVEEGLWKGDSVRGVPVAKTRTASIGAAAFGATAMGALAVYWCLDRGTQLF